MNKLTTAKRTAVVAALVEGNSIRSTVRMTNVSKPTILKLLAELGEACAVYHHAYVRGLKSRRIQADEIWSYCYSKAKNVPAEKKGVLGYGDVWTWTAIDADTKLIVSYLVGSHGPSNCYDFMKDVASRLTSRVQLATDGLNWYVDAVDHAFGIDVDFGMITKHYGTSAPADAPANVRYSPATITSVIKEVITGRPERTPHLHVLRGASEPLDADGYASLHASHERLFEEAGEPPCCERAVSCTTTSRASIAPCA